VISCKECKRRLYPEDPSLPVGPYHHSTCDYFCNKPTYYRELELTKVDVKQPTNKELLDKLHRIEVLMNDLENRLNRHIDFSKKKYTTYPDKEVVTPTPTINVSTVQQSP